MASGIVAAGSAIGYAVLGLIDNRKNKLRARRVDKIADMKTQKTAS